MRWTILTIFLIISIASSASADGCSLYVDTIQTMDDSVTSNWCTSQEDIDHFWDGLSLEEEKVYWLGQYSLQGSNICETGTLTQLFNAAWMLYGIQWYRDNITLNQPTMDWGEYVFHRSGDSYVGDCEDGASVATNHSGTGWTGTNLHLKFWRLSVPSRAASLVHEATHEDVSHVYKGTLCYSLFDVCSKDVFCRQKLCAGDSTCLGAFGECENMWPSTWCSGEKGSMDIGFGLNSAQTMEIKFLLEAADTYLKDPVSNELLIKQYTDTECGYVPILSPWAYEDVATSIWKKYQACFLITPFDPANSAYWVDVFSAAWYSDYTSVMSNYVAPQWYEGRRSSCTRPCVSQDYLSACNELYQPDNKYVNQYNYDLCESINAGLPEKATAAQRAQAADQFKKGKKECISGVTTQYLEEFCQDLITSSPTLLDLETNFKIEDEPGYFIPDSVFASCEKDYCKQRFDPSWAQAAKDNCYHYDDPLGCAERLCGKLGNDPTDFENFKMLLCRKGYFDNNGEPKDYMTKDAGKCDQDYMDCVAQEAFTIWLASDECTLKDQPSNPYHYIAHLPQSHALNLATSGISYDQYTALCSYCELNVCEAKWAGCTSFMRDMASKLGEFLTYTAIPKQIVVRENGMPTGPSIDPVIKPIERSLKTIVEMVANPTNDGLGYREIVDQLLTVPEYLHASARALGYEAFFSIFGTKGFQNIFPKETLALFDNATLRFDFDLNARQQALLPALAEISTTRQRIEAPATLSIFETLATSNPRGMFDFIQGMSGTQSVSGINTLLDSLVVTPQPPFAPTLLSPSNGATGVSANPTLSWNASPGATSYRLQVSTTAGFSSILQDISGISGTSTVVGLAEGTTYFWRVSATNAQGTSGWSSVWSFTTLVTPQPPFAPTLRSPSNGATGVSANPTLSWNASAGAISYGLQISTRPDFSGIVLDQNNIPQTSITASLVAGATYYWRVNATNSVGTSDWSLAWSFTTAYSLPQPPTLLSPADGSTNVSTSPTFTWNASSGATTYRLQIATDNTFRTVVYDQDGIAGTSQSVTGLHGGKLHYWRCSASNSAGTSQWSDVWSFTTGR